METVAESGLSSGAQGWQWEGGRPAIVSDWVLGKAPSD